jgi:hypothetical protein
MEKMGINGKKFARYSYKRAGLPNLKPHPGTCTLANIVWETAANNAYKTSGMSKITEFF